MKTLLIAASTNPERYSYKAAESLVRHGHEIVMFGLKNGTISNEVIHTTLIPQLGIDTVSLYVHPNNQKTLYEYILQLKPRRIIFNPGTENEELMQMAEAHGIEAIEGCTLVMLSVGTY